MRRLMMFGVAATMLGAAAPAAAYTFANSVTPPGTCTVGAFTFCMDFQLVSHGSDQYTLTVKYLSTTATPAGAVKTVGLYGPNGSTGAVSAFAASDDAVPSQSWSNSTGTGEFVSAEAPPPPSQNGLAVGKTVTVSFTSTFLTAYRGVVEARAHVVGWGDESCSVWVSNTSTNGIKDGGAFDPACTPDGGGGGQGTVTPEPITLVLLGSGLFGIGGVQLRRRRKNALIEEENA